MKKLLLSLSVLIILGLPKLSAQLINSDFETWHQNSVAPAGVKDPNTGNGTNGWWDFNFANATFLSSSPVTVFQDSTHPSPYSGSYCAKIVSQRMVTSTYTALKSYGFPYDTINGILVTAFVNVVIGFPPTISFKPGVPFNKRISSYSFWYQYKPNGGNGADTCSCSVLLYHYSGGAHHVIGEGLWTNSQTVNNWAKATVNIFYDSAKGNPDTILIQYSACSVYPNGKPKTNDTMAIDSGTVFAGIGDIAAEQHDNVNLYPNPAQNEVNLAVTGQFEASKVEVYDITGRVVGKYSMSNNSLTINTQAYNSGIYLYKLLDNTGAELNVGKFSVVK